MRLICPRCQGSIEARDVNVSTDLAKCARCDEVFKASDLMTDEDLSENLDPPAGSKITFEARGAGNAAILIPRRGVAGSDVFAMAFATFWIGFVAFWTFGAAMGGGFFALFSIPFWLAGLAMWSGILSSITERQLIEVQEQGISVVKKSALWSRRHFAPYAEIDSIEVQPVVPRDPITAARHMRHLTKMSPEAGGIPLPTISHGTEKLHFAENVSEAETEWLVKVLKAVVFKKTGKKV